MPRYIDADKFLKSEIKRCGCEPVIGTCTNDNKSLKDVINEFPTADVQEVRLRKLQIRRRIKRSKRNGKN